MTRAPEDAARGRVAVSCAELESWLDAGMPQADAGEARGHAAACGRCAAALAAAEELEVLLLTGPAPAPLDFTERVMVQLGESSERAPALPVRASLPWWIRAAAEPAAVLAMLVAGLLLWRWEALWSLTRAAATGLAQGAGAALAGWAGVALARAGAGALGRPAVQLGLELALLCLALVSFPALYRWTSSLTARGVAARSR